MSQSHSHTADCWLIYNVCGEHHAHTYDCGNGELSPACPHWLPCKLGRIRSGLMNAETLLEDALQEAKTADDVLLQEQLASALASLERIERGVIEKIWALRAGQTS